METDDKDTRAVFGDYVSIYDIQDAVDDGATVPIYYESRLAKLDINQAEIEQLSDQVEEIFEDEESVALREAAKTKWAALEKLVGAEPRIKQVAADIVQHFEARNAAVDGKAMIVAMSREICVDLFDAIVALRPQWKGTLVPSRTRTRATIRGWGGPDVMTGSAADDANCCSRTSTTPATKKLLEKRFKDPKDPLKLVIVRDMWLTGFDVPCLHTMYVDKPMRDHNLMQAIARVNRVFRDKEGGLVVDYIGIAAELRRALKTYTESRGKGQPTLDTAEALAKLKELMEVARGHPARLRLRRVSDSGHRATAARGQLRAGAGRRQEALVRRGACDHQGVLALRHAGRGDGTARRDRLLPGDQERHRQGDGDRQEAHRRPKERRAQADSR